MLSTQKMFHTEHSYLLGLVEGNKHIFLMRKSKLCAISVKSSWHLQCSKSWHFSWLLWFGFVFWGFWVVFFVPFSLVVVCFFILFTLTDERNLAEKIQNEGLASFLIIPFPSLLNKQLIHPGLWLFWGGENHLDIFVWKHNVPPFPLHAPTLLFLRHSCIYQDNKLQVAYEEIYFHVILAW